MIPDRYRAAAAAIGPELAKSPYIPASRDARVGYLGTTETGRVCTLQCVTCCDVAPLRGDHGRAQPEPHYGFGEYEFARQAAKEEAQGGPDWWLGEACDRCGVGVLDLSQRCQAEHEEQQAQWTRAATGYPTLVEYGVQVNPRCRVY